MSLLSVMNIDLASQTLILNCTVDSNLVDNITFDNSTQNVTFDSRDDIIISFSEFIAFCNQLFIFQQAIFNNYGTDPFATNPFLQLIVNELHDVGMWNLTITAHTDPNVVEYQGTKSSQKLEMLPRAGSKTLTYAEWLKFLIAINHYKNSILGF